MSLNRLRELAGIREPLFENMADYRNMFSFLKQFGVTLHRGVSLDGFVQEIIKSAVDALGDFVTVTQGTQEIKKQKPGRKDRVIWYLRLARTSLLTDLIAFKEIPEDKMIAANTIAKKFIDGQGGVEYANMILYNFLNKAQHFLSLELPQINQIVWKNQTLSDLISQMETIEKRWQDTRRRQIPYEKEESEAEPIIEFPDGWAWWNLNVSSCSDEGDAMGHCGNTAANRRSERVLSLRQTVIDRGKEFHVPYATFILDTNTGKLGEMKGRNNEKPTEDLHPYIIALLENPIIEGIKGGGYRPQNNFSLNDLDSSERDELLEKKPELATPSQRYVMLRNSNRPIPPSLADDINDEAIDLGIDSVDKIDFENEVVHLEFFIDINDFARSTGWDILEKANDMYNKTLDDDLILHNQEWREYINDDDTFHLISSIPEDYQKRLALLSGINPERISRRDILPTVILQNKNSNFDDIMNDIVAQYFRTYKEDPSKADFGIVVKALVYMTPLRSYVYPRLTNENDIANTSVEAMLDLSHFIELIESASLGDDHDGYYEVSIHDFREYGHFNWVNIDDNRFYNSNDLLEEASYHHLTDDQMDILNFIIKTTGYNGSYGKKKSKNEQVHVLSTSKLKALLMKELDRPEEMDRLTPRFIESRKPTKRDPLFEDLRRRAGIR